jgi:hypothetical protein
VLYKQSQSPSGGTVAAGFLARPSPLRPLAFPGPTVRNKPNSHRAPGEAIALREKSYDGFDNQKARAKQSQCPRAGRQGRCGGPLYKQSQFPVPPGGAGGTGSGGAVQTKPILGRGDGRLWGSCLDRRPSGLGPSLGKSCKTKPIPGGAGWAGGFGGGGGGAVCQQSQSPGRRGAAKTVDARSRRRRMVVGEMGGVVRSVGAGPRACPVLG